MCIICSEVVEATSQGVVVVVVATSQGVDITTLADLEHSTLEFLRGVVVVRIGLASHNGDLTATTPAREFGTTVVLTLANQLLEDREP